VIVTAIVAIASAACSGEPLAPQVTPECSWPLRVLGTAPTEEIGLVRCYVRDLSERDAAALTSLIAQNGTPGRITAVDLKYSADALAGIASARFKQNPADPTNATVSITYADNAIENVGLDNMTAFGGPSVWRMTIGTSWR
jgi:hypothetical protein